MPGIQRITNENPDVEAKVNYFIDRFNHHVLYGGSEWHMELENQLSLIEKIHFQLTKDPEYRVVYFDNYFAHEYFNDDEEWESYPSYQNVRKVIIAYKSATTEKDKKQLLNQASFVRALEKLLEELRFHMPEYLMKWLMSIFLCIHPLDEHDHINKLNLLAKLIVSEGYFSGKLLNDLNEVITRIFYNRDEKNYGDGRFPFPAEVKKSERKKYLNARSLENQIRGFKSVMQENPHSGIVIMRIFGSVRLPEDFEFEYNGVYFLGSATKKILKVKNSIPEKKDDFAAFFKDDECFYIAAKIEWFSFFNVKYRMRSVVAEQLDYFSSILHRNLEVDHTDSFIIATNIWKFVGGSYAFRTGAKHYQDYELEVLKDNNVHYALSKCKASPAAQHIFSIEPQLIRALKSGVISDYWQYLESLIPLNNNGGKQIKDIVPRILLINEKNTSDNRIFRTMIDAFDLFNGGYDRLGINPKQMSGIRKKMIGKQVPEPVRKFEYPFIRELLKEHDQVIDGKYYEKARQYYHGILTEAYAIRNFDVHAGTGNNRSLIKIQKSLPGMVFRLRGLLFDEIKQHPNISMDIIISLLYEKSGKLLSAEKSK